MEVITSVKMRFSEVEAIVQAVTTQRLIHAWNYAAHHITDEERRQAGQGVLMCEALLRSMGAEVPPLPERLADATEHLVAVGVLR